MKPESIFKPDYDNIYVIAGTPGIFPALARKYMDGWDEALFENNNQYELGLLVLSNNEWFGALLVRRAETQTIERDRYLGWNTYQQVERNPLVLEVLRYLPRGEACYRPEYGVRALHAAVSRLAEFWKMHYNYHPLLADCHMDPHIRMPDYFRGAGWTRVTDRNPEKFTSYWVKELVPGAKRIITAKSLEKAYKEGTSDKLTGLLPIADELLPSLVHAFKTVHDDREVNKQHPLHSILATTFLALLCGNCSVSSIVRFSKRLSAGQAAALGFHVHAGGQVCLPGYHTFYRILRTLDRVQLSECFIRWVSAHEEQLPKSLQFAGRVMRDALVTFVKYLGTYHPM